MINLKAIELEKISLSNMQNARTVSEYIDCRSQVFLRNRGKLTQPIQMQLSKKQKAFSKFFSAFLKSK